MYAVSFLRLSQFDTPIAFELNLKMNAVSSVYQKKKSPHFVSRYSVLAELQGDVCFSTVT